MIQGFGFRFLLGLRLVFRVQGLGSERGLKVCRMEKNVETIIL